MPSSIPARAEAMTHKQAVRRMATWLRVTKRFTVIVSELTTQNEETPDVIGFIGPGRSTLIECKVSRADFLADRHKRFRVIEAAGMGDLRYFAAPAGMLAPDEIPEGWGLLEITDGRAVRERKAPSPKPADKRAEVKLLMSAIRRLEISTAVFVRPEDPADPEPA
jgi:hypothetical protein